MCPRTRSTPLDADLPARLAAGLGAISPVKGTLVQDENVTLTPLEAPTLGGWQVIDVLVRLPLHPQRFYAALCDDGTALVLTASPESFSEMTRSAEVLVDDASGATDLAVLYLDVTRDFDWWSYRIDSVSDIGWVMTAEAEEQRTTLQNKYASLIHAPRAEPSAAGWTVTAWTVYGLTLVRHTMSITSAGAVHDSQDVVETNIPVPASL